MCPFSVSVLTRTSGKQGYSFLFCNCDEENFQWRNLLNASTIYGILSLETHYAEQTGGQEQATRDSFAALLSLYRQAGSIVD